MTSRNVIVRLFESAANGYHIKWRSPVSTLIDFPGEKRVLIDCAWDISRKLQLSNVDPASIDAIFITRRSLERTAGLLPLVRASLKVRQADEQRKDVPLQLYGPPGFRNWISHSFRLMEPNYRGNWEFREVFPRSYFSSPAAKFSLPSIIDRVIEDQSVQLHSPIAGWRVEAVELPLTRDAGTSLGFAFREMSQTASLIPTELGTGTESIITDTKRSHPDERPLPKHQPRKIVILGDTSDARPALEVARNADLLVHPCTFVPLEGLEGTPKSSWEATRIPVVSKSRLRSMEAPPEWKAPDRLQQSHPEAAGKFARLAQVERLYLNNLPTVGGFDDRSLVEELPQQEKNRRTVDVCKAASLQATKAWGLETKVARASRDSNTIIIPPVPLET